jgi:hypothetical protein
MLTHIDYPTVAYVLALVCVLAFFPLSSYLDMRDHAKRMRQARIYYRATRQPLTPIDRGTQARD